MRAWLLVCSCYLQPTVFEGGARIPSLQPEAPLPPPDQPVGCITHERVSRHVGIWWLGKRRVGHDEIDRALQAWPPGKGDLARAHRDQRLSMGLWIAGAAVAVGSLAGMFGWLHSDDSSQPLSMLGSVAAGYAIMISS